MAHLFGATLNPIKGHLADFGAWIKAVKRAKKGGNVVMVEATLLGAQVVRARTSNAVARCRENDLPIVPPNVLQIMDEALAEVRA